MFTALLILQVLLGVTMIALILLQQGKGADMGAAFGAGASGTVFGARGSGSFFTRTTAILATLFFANSVLLSSPLILGDRHAAANRTVTDSVVTEQPAESAPAPQSGEAGDLPPPSDLPETDNGGAPADTGAPAATEQPAAAEPAASGESKKAPADSAADNSKPAAADKDSK